MKPDWKDAPKWAKYLAMDSDGCWFWYSHKPHKGQYHWLAQCRPSGQAQSAYIPGWDNTSERRP